MKPLNNRRPVAVPTLRMIAEMSGVSRETVSHILGGKLAGRYKEATRVKVLEIAGKLNYRPHRGAQAMKTGYSNLIAIAHSGMGIEAAEKANLTLSRIINEKGYDYLALDMNWFGGCIDRTLTEIIRGRAEGLLISHIPAAFQDSHVEELKRAGIPIVSVNGIRRPNVPLFSDNLEKAFGDMTEHLLGNGHRCIILPIASSDHLSDGTARTIRERGDGFRKVIESHGRWINWTEEEFFEKWPTLHSECLKSGKEVIGITVEQELRLYNQVDKPVYRFCTRFFPNGPLPDAIVCSNDLYAMEVIAAAFEHGIRVPDQLAVTGYDNDRIGEFPCFGITTAEQDIETMCHAAVDSLISQIRQPGEEWQNQKFDPTLIIRTSCGAAKAGKKSLKKSPKNSPKKRRGGQGVIMA